MTGDQTLVRLVHAIDRLDWPIVRECLADTVVVDYSELTGDPAASLPANDLIAQWRGMLPGFIATQHLLGPLVVETAAGFPVAHAHVRAWHYIPDSDPWVVAGHYEARLDPDGRISGLTLRVYRIDGPEDAAERATTRAASAPPR